jgi:hypothetical protein
MTKVDARRAGRPLGSGFLGSWPSAGRSDEVPPLAVALSPILILGTDRESG